MTTEENRQILLDCLDKLANTSQETIRMIVSSDNEADHRWIAIGTTNLQQGFMALRRAITRPEQF